MDFDSTNETITPVATTLLTVAGTGGVAVPVGTTAERPSSPSNGILRYNTTLNVLEGFINSSWDQMPGTGTVTSVSVTSANGLAGTVATSTSTPAITLSTTVTGVLKGNGTAISAAGTTDITSLVDTVYVKKAGDTMTGTLNLTTGAELAVENTAGSQTFRINFDAGTGAPSLGLDSTFGAMIWMQNAVNPQILFGSDAAATANVFLDADNDAIMNLNALHTGAVRVGQGGLRISRVGGGAPYLGLLSSASTSTSYDLTFPPSQGGSGQYLQNNGSGVLSWATSSSGTVTSVSGSGGSTGLTLSGGPITSSGTLTLGGSLAPNSGGTGATSAPTSGQVLIGNSSGGYTLNTLTGGTGILVNSLSGSVGITAFDVPLISMSDATGPCVIGRDANSTGQLSYITSSSDNQVLRRSGNFIAWGSINLASTAAVGTSVLSVTNGGTGSSTTPTNGQLLIGNGTGYSVSSLTAGSGITITPGSGSVTIASNTVSGNAAGNIGVSPSGGGTGWTLISGTQYRADFVHNLGTTNVVVTIYDTSNSAVIIAQELVTLNANTVRITVTGNTKTLKVVVVANGSAIVAGGSTPSSVVTAKDGVTISTAATKINWSGQAVNVTDAGSGTTNVTIGSRFTFFAESLSTPVNSDFAVNALASIVTDPSFPAINVRSFNNTTEQGVSFLVSIPSGATQATFKIRGRAQTAQGAVRVVQPRIYTRLLTNNGSVTAWSAAKELANITIPNNTFFQYGLQTIPLSTLGLVADNLYQIELTRRTSGVTGGTNLGTNFLMAELTVEFS